MSISRTAHNTYEKIDKDNYMLLLAKNEEPYSFFDKNKIVKDMNPEHFDEEKFDMKETVEKLQEFLRKRTAISENGIDDEKTSGCSKIKVKNKK